MNVNFASKAPSNNNVVVTYVCTLEDSTEGGEQSLSCVPINYGSEQPDVNPPVRPPQNYVDTRKSRATPIKKNVKNIQHRGKPHPAPNSTPTKTPQTLPHIIRRNKIVEDF